MRNILVWAGMIGFSAAVLSGASGAAAQDYIGSAACGDCHVEQYENFTKYSKKAGSRHSVEIMASDLTPEEQRGCYDCHTTGYGKGGFVDYETTPHLADVGCETCHGPGGEHADMGDPELITLTPELETCTACHNAERVEDFNFKPLIFSGAH